MDYNPKRIGIFGSFARNENKSGSDLDILEYTSRLIKKDFAKNTLVQDAVIRNFEIIGEATKKVSNDFRQVNSEIPWKEMAGMRGYM